jgi:hypothetical protein
VVADHVDDRRERAPGVVQVGQAVGEPGAGVQQRARRAVGHARIAVGGAGDDPFGQPEHAAQARLAVERGDEVHLRRARVGEAVVHPLREQRLAKQVGAGAGGAGRVGHGRRDQAATLR